MNTLPTVVGIAGSARRWGNSDRLLGEALQAASQEGAETTRILPRDLSLDPCQACDACRGPGRCVIDDRADSTHTRLKAASALIVATPIYFGGLPAHFKALVDRAQVQHWLWEHSGSPSPQRPALLLVVGGRPRIHNALAGIRTTVAGWLAVLGFRLWEVRGYAGMDEPNTVGSHPQILEEARELGRCLVKTGGLGR